ncbi:MAG TPA: hypothetical protein VG937_07990 [Polyangiaceae bacterium]|nr:hypothetical protein [Polyangiaceae bacterium]
MTEQFQRRRRESKALRQLAFFLAFTAGIVPGCVEREVVGTSTQLLLLDSPSTSLSPGASVSLAFQAADDAKSGVPDQRLEVVVTDTSRLNFNSDPSASRVVVLTGRHEAVGGVVVDGAGIVALTVPDSAKPGQVTVIASLEGQRGASSKTRWVTFEIDASAGVGGAAGMGGTAGSGGRAETGGAPDAGGGGMVDVGGATGGGSHPSGGGGMRANGGEAGNG